MIIEKGGHLFQDKFFGEYDQNDEKRSGIEGELIDGKRVGEARLERRLEFKNGSQRSSLQPAKGLNLGSEFLERFNFEKKQDPFINYIGTGSPFSSSSKRVILSPGGLSSNMGAVTDRQRIENRFCTP